MGRAVTDIGECISFRIRSELEWSHGRIHFPNSLSHLRIIITSSRRPNAPKEPPPKLYPFNLFSHQTRVYPATFLGLVTSSHLNYRIQTNMGQHNSRTYKSSQEAPRLITIRRRNTAPYATIPPAYGQREAEGITTPTCLERTYVTSYLSDPCQIPRAPSHLTRPVQRKNQP